MNGAAIMQGVIENHLDALHDDHIREASYEALLPVLLDAGCDNLDSCLGEDDVFDGVFRVEWAERNG